MTQLFLDLGDILTKACAPGARKPRFGFPSVVARRLLPADAPAGDLLVDDGGADVPRLDDFDADDYPRTRSYPGGDEFLREARPAPGARFTGWHAAAYGADRQLLGRHPSDDNVEALIHRALRPGAAGADRAEIAFVIDAGAKAAAIARYAAASPREVAFVARRFDAARAGRVQLEVSCRLVDAADCAAAMLRDVAALRDCARIAVVDIGYLRTKLAIVSDEGCEHQQQLDDVGVSGCVRRVLRDCQERGLVEDEIAVIRALERSHATLAVAGRSFDIRAPFARARAAIERELARGVERALAAHYGGRGSACKGVAIIGGGAAVAGDGLARALEAAGLGVDACWVTADRFLLVEGARRLAESRRRPV